MVGTITAVALAAAFTAWYQPTFFVFHGPASDRAGKTAGAVFRRGAKLFLVQLETGSQLTVDLGAQTVFLSREKGRSAGLRLGRYLILSKRDIRGSDLSKAEGFDRQRPIVTQEAVTLRDPLTRNGEFSFALTNRR